MAFLSVSTFVVITILSVNFLTLLFYSKRLSAILDKKFSTSFALVNLGYGLNTILPFRMGEIAKLFYAKTIFLIPASQFVVATFIEKILDVVFLGLLLSFFLLFSVQEYINIKLLLLVLATLAGAVIFILMIRKSIGKIQNKEVWNGKIQHFLLAVDEYSKGHSIKKLMLLSALVWVSNILAIYITFNVLLPIDFPLVHAVGLLIVLALAVAIPAAPAGLGLFEAGIVAYLVSVLHINNEVALMSAILFHLAVTFPQFITMVAVLGFSKFQKRQIHEH